MADSSRVTVGRGFIDFPGVLRRVPNIKRVSSPPNRAARKVVLVVLDLWAVVQNRRGDRTDERQQNWVGRYWQTRVDELLPGLLLELAVSSTILLERETGTGRTTNKKYLAWFPITTTSSSFNNTIRLPWSRQVDGERTSPFRANVCHDCSVQARDAQPHDLPYSQKHASKTFRNTSHRRR